MCGIGLLALFPNANKIELNDGLLRDWNQSIGISLASRGPDVPRQKYHVASGSINNGEQWSVTLHASVLHMRGKCPAAQPISFTSKRDAQNCALCWNGECYTYNEMDGTADGNMVELISSSTSDEEQSDTILVTKLVQQAIAHSGMGEHEAIADVMSRIHGEYSFILYVPSTETELEGCIYYGRDCLGRRSLLVNKSLQGVVAVSSVAMGGPVEENSLTTNKWEEIPPGIVYRLDMCTGEETLLPIPIRIPNTRQEMNQSLEQSADECADILLKLLDRAVQRRVMQAPRPKSQSTSDASVAVLFSGGIDSVVLAALSHRHVPTNQPIDLINVSFYNTDVDLGGKTEPTSPDRLAAILSYHEMLLRFPERRWRFIAVDVPYREVLDHEKHIRNLISPLDSTMDYNIATAFWFAGRGKGRLFNPNEVEEVGRGLESKGEMCKETGPKPPQEPLLRFATGDKHNNAKSRPTCIREGCTRLAPRSGCVFQACKFCCGKLQGPISSYLGRSARLCSAHNNTNSEKRNKGIHRSSNKPTEVGKRQEYPSRSDGHSMTSSHAKILLSGVGADEQMAGYGRHRTTYQRGGYEALASELHMEVNRLWTRNLGRDDRCLSDHGKEARFPYLDEDVMAYLKALPLEKKCDMTRPLGEGDKLILRRVARMIGVMECSTLQKRAIQFGSRIAKVSDKSRFGSCRKATGQKKMGTENS